MFFRRRNARSKAGRKVGYRKRVYKRRGVPKSVKRYVKKELHRNLENKEITTYSSNGILTCVNNTTPNGNILITSVTQGTTNGTRTGNNIRIVSGIIRGRVNLLPYNAVTNPLSTPILVKMFLVRHLGISGTTTNLAGYDWTNFFRTSGGSMGFTNSPVDMDLPVNNEYWRLLKTKTFKIGAGYASGTGQVGTGGYFDNSPMTVPFYFNWGKYCKKILNFNDNTGYCTNENISLAVQVINADGSATATQPAEWHWVNNFKFEDA